MHLSHSKTWVFSYSLCNNQNNQNFALPVPHLGVLGNGFCSPVATAVSATTLTGFYSSRATILLRTTLLQPPKSRETGLNNVSRARLPAR